MGNALCFSMMNDEPHHVELEIPDRRLVTTSKFHSMEPWKPFGKLGTRSWICSPHCSSSSWASWGALDMDIAPFQ